MELTPIAYFNKIRLEKAFELLISSKRTVLDIATSCGFESLSGFYKAFEKKYKVTPGKLQSDLCSNIVEMDSNIGEVISGKDIYSKDTNNFMKKVWSMSIKVKQLPEMRVAYVRKIGSYLDPVKEHWQKLVEWSGNNGLFPPHNQFIGISMDDTSIVPKMECRHDAAVVLPEGFIEDKHSEISFKTIEGGLYGILNFYDVEKKLGISYQMLTEWIPHSIYKREDKPALEILLNNPKFDPEGKCKVELCIPVVELNEGKE